jgi:hypothetical protein
MFFFLKFGKNFKFFIIELILICFFIVPMDCLAVVLNIKIICVENFSLRINHKRLLLFIFFLPFIYSLKQGLLCHEQHRLFLL